MSKGCKRGYLLTLFQLVYIYLYPLKITTAPPLSPLKNLFKKGKNFLLSYKEKQELNEKRISFFFSFLFYSFPTSSPSTPL